MEFNVIILREGFSKCAFGKQSGLIHFHFFQMKMDFRKYECEEMLISHGFSYVEQFTSMSTKETWDVHITSSFNLGEQ